MVLLGASLDGVSSHARWAEEEGFTFTLLADSGGALSKAFGVHRGLGPLAVAARTTFLIDRDGKVAKVFESVEPRGHADEVIQALQALGLWTG